MFDVAGVGTNSVDEVLLLAEDTSFLFSTGKARIRDRRLACGGQTATTVSACAVLGMRSRYVGAFGSDGNGRLVREALAHRGVDLTATITCEAPNRNAVILVDPGGRRTVCWQRADGLQLTPGDIESRVIDARVVHIDDDDPDVVLHVARLARAARAVVTSDIEHLSDAVEPLLSTVTYPILDQHLPARLTGETDPERALRKLRRLNAGVLCMTLGERGAAALEGDRFHVAPAFQVNVVDSTGGGDVFRAGFIYGLLQGWDVPAMLRFANAAAAVSCTRLGAIASVPTLGEIEALLDRPKAQSPKPGAPSSS